MDTEAPQYARSPGINLAATRRRLYSGIGLGAASAIGCVIAALLELVIAMILFGLAIPVLGWQTWREYHRLRYLKRHTPQEWGDIRSTN